MMKICFLFLILPCLSWAQYEYDVIRFGKTVRFISFERIGGDTVLDISAQDEKGKVYSFALPDQHRHLSEKDIVSPVQWCAVVTSRANVVGVIHIGECTREEISNVNSRFFIGSDEIKRSLSQIR